MAHSSSTSPPDSESQFSIKPSSGAHVYWLMPALLAFVVIVSLNFGVDIAAWMGLAFASTALINVSIMVLACAVAWQCINWALLPYLRPNVQDLDWSRADLQIADSYNQAMKKAGRSDVWVKARWVIYLMAIPILVPYLAWFTHPFLTGLALFSIAVGLHFWWYCGHFFNDFHREMEAFCGGCFVCAGWVLSAHAVWVSISVVSVWYLYLLSQKWADAHKSTTRYNRLVRVRYWYAFPLVFPLGMMLHMAAKVLCPMCLSCVTVLTSPTVWLMVLPTMTLIGMLVHYMFIYRYRKFYSVSEDVARFQHVFECVLCVLLFPLIALYACLGSFLEPVYQSIFWVWQMIMKPWETRALYRVKSNIKPKLSGESKNNPAMKSLNEVSQSSTKCVLVWGQAASGYLPETECQSSSPST